MSMLAMGNLLKDSPNLDAPCPVAHLPPEQDVVEHLPVYVVEELGRRDMRSHTYAHAGSLGLRQHMVIKDTN